MENRDDSLGAKGAGRLLGVEPKTLANWRYLGKGPSYIKISPRCIRYRVVDLINYLEKRKVALED